jgi:hypothetical protein
MWRVLFFFIHVPGSEPVITDRAPGETRILAVPEIRDIHDSSMTSPEGLAIWNFGVIVNYNTTSPMIVGTKWMEEWPCGPTA